MSLKQKLRTWLYRYGPAEIAGTICTLVAGTIAAQFTESFVVLAYIGSTAENLGFYAYIIMQEVRSTKALCRKANVPYSILFLLKDIRNIVLEFGIGELFDWFVIRPASIFFALSNFSNLQVALFVGKILGNIGFYIPTVISYELRKRFLKDKILRPRRIRKAAPHKREV